MAQKPHVATVRPRTTSHAVQSHEEVIPNADSRIQEARLADRVRGLQQNHTSHQEE